MKKTLLALLLCAVPAFAQTTKGSLSQNFSLPTNVYASVPFNVTEFDVPAFVNQPGPGVTGGGYSSIRVNDRIYAFAPGIYYFFAQVYFQVSCKGTVRTVGLMKNGDDKQILGSFGSIPQLNCLEAITYQVSGFSYMNPGDYVTLNVYQNTGDALPILARYCDSLECSSATWIVAIKVW